MALDSLRVTAYYHSIDNANAPEPNMTTLIKTAAEVIEIAKADRTVSLFFRENWTPRSNGSVYTLSGKNTPERRVSIKAVESLSKASRLLTLRRGASFAEYMVRTVKVGA
jgi:hypothetical protein